MLDLMRKKAGSWMIKIILGAIVVVFVFWGVGSFNDQQNSRIATVNGQSISYEEYNAAYSNIIERLTRQFGNNLNDEILKMMNVKQQALDTVIDKRLLLAEADRLSLRVSDQELSEAIQRYPAFQNNGVFDGTLYRRMLDANRLSAQSFEAMQREQMLIDKVSRIVSTGVAATETEARSWYEWENASVRVTYALFDPAAYPEPELTDADIAAFFESEKKNYETEPMRKVRYLVFMPEDFLKDITVTDDDITAFYEANPEQFETPKTVEARHILFRVAEDADPGAVDAALKKAKEVHSMAVEGKDFAELADTYSEDPGNTGGGLLRAFKKEEMVPEFAEKAFSMAAGEISEPVRTPFGWHLIKVEKVNEAAVTPLEKARPDIRAKLLEEESQTRAYDAAEAAYEDSFTESDLSKIGASADKTVQETDWFTRSGPTAMPEAADFARSAFLLSENEVSEVVRLGNHFYLIQLVAEKPAVIPELNAVKERVATDLKARRREEKARSEAEAFIAKLKADPSTMEETAKKEGRPTASTPFFGRGGPIPQLGSEQELIGSAFSLSAQSPLAALPVKTAKGYAVIRLDEKKLPDTDGFDAQKEQLILRLTRQKQAQAFSSLMSHLRQGADISVEKGFMESTATP